MRVFVSVGLIVFSILSGVGCSSSSSTDETSATTSGTTQKTASAAVPSGITMVNIPGGTFTMGDNTITGSENLPDLTEHDVTVSTFSMSEAEITNGQFKDFLNAALQDGLISVSDGYVLGTSGSSYQDRKLIELSGTRVLKDHDGDSTIDPENPLNQCWVFYDSGTAQFSIKDPQSIDWDNYAYESGETRSTWSELSVANLPSQSDVENWPATFVKWFGAYAFATYYKADLPSEAEWEYAARGGQSLTYPTDDGTISASKANFNENNVHPDVGHVVAVKSYAANPYGVYDMGGNAWEWVLDFYGASYYTDSEGATDPVNEDDVEPTESSSCTGTPGGAYNCVTHVRRGGSWNYHQDTLKSGYRAIDYNWRGNDHFGFRIVTRL